MKCRELTHEEACTLYDAGLREWVEFFYPECGWNVDACFNPRKWPKVKYRVSVGDE